MFPGVPTLSAFSALEQGFVSLSFGSTELNMQIVMQFFLKEGRGYKSPNSTAPGEETRRK